MMQQQFIQLNSTIDFMLHNISHRRKNYNDNRESNQKQVEINPNLIKLRMILDMCECI